MLLRTLLAWLRGEPRVCTMARVPSLEEEDARRPGRERDKLVRERVGLENQVQSLVVLHGIHSFRPRLRKRRKKLRRCGLAPARAAAADDGQLPAPAERLSVVSDRSAEIDAARVPSRAPNPDGE